MSNIVLPGANLTPPLERFHLLRGGKVWIQRDDLIDEIVSGNKWRKLLGWLEWAARRGEIKRIITFGGAFSNHMVAVASAGRKLGIETWVVLRGDEDFSNRYLNIAQECGMGFFQVERGLYRRKLAALIWSLEASLSEADNDGVWQFDLLNYLRGLEGDERAVNFADGIYFNGTLVVPEGGRGEGGSAGFRELYDLWEGKGVLEQFGNECHIVHASATATTAIGLASVFYNAEIHSVMVLKNQLEQEAELNQYLTKDSLNRVHLLSDYTWGGYAKYRPELIDFIIKIQQLNPGVLLDPIYTGKAIWAMQQLWDNGKIEDGDKWVFLHTGGQLSALQ